MNTVAAKLFHDALALTDAERAELAARIIESLVETRDDDWQSAWDEELQRRLESLDSGASKTVPWSEARRTIFGENQDEFAS
jgi:putative addiction module component (TIGR02574 family)